MSSQYWDIHSKIQSGDVIFWDFGMLTPLIRKYTGKTFMRCGLAWCLPNGEITVLGTGIFSPINYVKNLSEKTPFYWVSTNLELNSIVRSYALIILKDKISIKNRIKNVIERLWEGNFNTACAEYLRIVLYRGGFREISKFGEYEISELVDIFNLRNYEMKKVSK